MTENVTHALEPDEEDPRNERKGRCWLIQSQTAACYCPFDPSFNKHWQRIAVGRLWEGDSPFKKITPRFLHEGLIWRYSLEALPAPPHISSLLLSMGPLHHEGDLDRWPRKLATFQQTVLLPPLPAPGSPRGSSM